jgi:hypothetical protein
MTGFTDYHAKHVLDYSTGKTAMPSLPTVYVALFTAVGSDAGTGFTEVSGGSYARVATAGADWNAASGSAPSLSTNANTLTFPTATGSWGTVIAIGAYDASSGGNLLWWDYLGAFDWQPFTCTLASPGVLTVPAHGFANSDGIVVSSEYGGSLPATGGSWSGLLPVAGATTDTFNLGVNTTGTGNGLLRKVQSQAVGSGITVIFTGGTPGQLALKLA